MADTAPARRERLTWRFWAFSAFMGLLMVLFVVLGIWQVERLGEKEHLIASVAARADLPPTPLPPVAEWAAFDADAYDFRPVRFSGTFLPAQTVLVFTSLGEPRGPYSGPGYWVMTPLALTTGGSIFVNRGFVPQDSAPAFAAGGPVPAGVQDLVGTARKSEAVGAFTPAPDTASHIEWVRDITRLAVAAGDLPEPVAPLYVDLPAGPKGALPQGGETVMEFPNNHLGYAATWFGFALLVPFLMWFWVRRQRQPSPTP